MRACPSCKLLKEDREFAKNARRGLEVYCRVCKRQKYLNFRWADPEKFKKRSAESHRLWRKNNPLKAFIKGLRDKYGISLEFFDELVLNQGGVCAICENNMSPPCVDHCHSTGKIRGLLCQFCNRSLGGFRDSVKSLRAAIAYLER